MKRARCIFCDVSWDSEAKHPICPICDRDTEKTDRLVEHVSTAAALCFGILLSFFILYYLA